MKIAMILENIVQAITFLVNFKKLLIILNISKIFLYIV